MYVYILPMTAFTDLLLMSLPLLTIDTSFDHKVRMVLSAIGSNGTIGRVSGVDDDANG